MRSIALARALTRIETRYGTRVIAQGDVATRRDAERRIASGTSLDRVTGGGIRAGEPLALIGPTTAGKLSLATTIAAAAQREGGMVAWIDPSASFDALAATRSGVDLARVIVVRAGDVDDVLLAGSAVLRSDGFRLAVVDVGPAFAPRCTVDDLAPLLPIVRGSSAALLVVAEERGRRVALPTVRVEPQSWTLRFGRTVGWSFAAGQAPSCDRALFCVPALDGSLSDLGTRADLVEAMA
jgi:RecA/RadA recombinase